MLVLSRENGLLKKSVIKNVYRLIQKTGIGYSYNSHVIK